MADPVVGITNGVPTSGTGTITTLGQTLLDGANLTMGATTDAAVAAGATGTWSAKLRAISRDLVANIVLAAGGNIIGKVGIDQTTPGTTNLVALAANQSINNAQINGITPLMGNGVTGTGSQRVTIASDNTAFSVNAAATLAAETTKNIGTVRLGDGTNTATVKAVSTAPVTATDQALTTVLRPDSPGIIATGSQASPSASYLSTVAAGDVAAGSSDSGNPQKIGGVGKTANPTAVTDGQRVNALFDKLGKQVTVEAIRDLKGVTQTSVSNTTSETTIVAAVASTFCDLYGLILANTGASTTKVTIKDATAGTTRAIIEVPTLETRGFMLPVSGAIPQATVNNNWTVTCGTATTALEVTALWVKNT